MVILKFACGTWKMGVGGTDLLAPSQLWSFVPLQSHCWLLWRVKHGWSCLSPAPGFTPVPLPWS